MNEQVDFCHGESDNWHACGAYASPCDGWFYNDEPTSCPCKVHRTFTPVGEERTTPQTESSEKEMMR